MRAFRGRPLIRWARVKAGGPPRLRHSFALPGGGIIGRALSAAMGWLDATLGRPRNPVGTGRGRGFSTSSAAIVLANSYR